MTEYIIFAVGVLVMMMVMGGLYITAMLEFTSASQKAGEKE